jgi:hypothetical protein
VPPFFRTFFGIPPWFLLFLSHVFHSMSGRIFEHFPLSSVPHLLFCQVVLFACFHPAYPSFSSPRSMLGMDNPQSGFVIDIAAGESENRYYIGVCSNSRITTVYISKHGDPVSRLISARQIIVMTLDKSLPTIFQTIDFQRKIQN